MTAGVSTHIEGKTEKTYGLKGKRMRTHAGLKNVWEKCASPLLASCQKSCYHLQCSALNENRYIAFLGYIRKIPWGGKLFPICYLVKTTSQFLQFMLQ